MRLGAVLYNDKKEDDRCRLIIRGECLAVANDVQSLDEIDQAILEALAGNARISLKELAQQVGLSSPSAAERLRRLEERGVIKAFTIDLDPAAVGYPLQAIVRVRPLPGQLHIVERIIQEIPEIIECDKVTGDDCFIARLVIRSMADLDGILDRVAERAETNTAMIKASPVKRRLPPLSRRK
nr:Lrp/AsnC family transcriptional regulator [Rhizobium leguminosarum]